MIIFCWKFFWVILFSAPQNLIISRRIILNFLPMSSIFYFFQICWNKKAMWKFWMIFFILLYLTHTWFNYENNWSGMTLWNTDWTLIFRLNNNNRRILDNIFIFIRQKYMELLLKWIKFNNSSLSEIELSFVCKICCSYFEANYWIVLNLCTV